MHQLLLSVSDSERLILYGGGAAVLGALSVLLFLVSLFAKRPRTPSQKSPQPHRVIGPASGATAGASQLPAPEESVVQIDEDDPRMAAAVTEAKKRLPEFIGAF